MFPGHPGGHPIHSCVTGTQFRYLSALDLHGRCDRRIYTLVSVPRTGHMDRRQGPR